MDFSSLTSALSADKHKGMSGYNDEVSSDENVDRMMEDEEMEYSEGESNAEENFELKRQLEEARREEEEIDRELEQAAEIARMMEYAIEMEFNRMVDEN